MGKLNKEDSNNHQKAEDLLWGKDKPLSFDEVEFCLRHWQPMAVTDVTKNAAFFTPLDLARELALNATIKGRIVDLCAGIGHLIWAILKTNYGWDGIDEICAVEPNPDYVKVGRRLIPEVNWINASIFDLSLWAHLGQFTTAVSNPPFGKVPTSTVGIEWLKYQGVADLMAVEVGMRVSTSDMIAIMPLLSSHPNTWYQDQISVHEQKATGLNKRRLSKQVDRFHSIWPQIVQESCSVDTTKYDHCWAGTTVKTALIRFSREPYFAQLPPPPAPTNNIVNFFNYKKLYAQGENRVDKITQNIK